MVVRTVRSIASGVLDDDQIRDLRVADQIRVLRIADPASEKPQGDILTLLSKASIDDLLGGEKNMLPLDKEKKGVRDILKALTVDEKKQMPDICMPIRHFRAEKVSTLEASSSLQFCVRLVPHLGFLFLDRETPRKPLKVFAMHCNGAKGLESMTCSRLSLPARRKLRMKTWQKSCSRKTKRARVTYVVMIMKDGPFIT